MHIPGAGDFTLYSVTSLTDPCPLPEKKKKGSLRRHLSEKETVLYAPFSDEGSVFIDKDALYIKIRENNLDREVVEGKKDENE